MIEIPKTTPGENKPDELRDNVNLNILKLFFEQAKNSTESNETGENEININVQGSIKGPDEFGNYVLSYDGKKILMNENFENVTGLEFVGITPYDDRYYICDIGQNCIFFDTQSGNLVEFAQVGNEIKPKIYGKDELSTDENMINLCENSIILYPGQSDDSLMLGFNGFLHEYFLEIIKQDIDEKSMTEQTSKFTKDYNKIKQFLYGIYQYMYNGKITKFLVGKDDPFREELKHSEILKRRYPSLYLAMRELDFLKNVLIDTNGEVIGYITIEKGICYYIKADGTVFKYDDFIGPNDDGIIITRQGEKRNFICEKFKYLFCKFDKIDGPDVNGNYILKKGSKYSIVSGKTGKILNDSGEESTGNEPNYVTESFEIINGPDINGNYMVKGSQCFLINSECEIISKKYISIDGQDENGNYKVFDRQAGSRCFLDKNGKEIQKK